MPDWTGGVQQQTGVLSFVLLAAGGFFPDTKSGCPACSNNLASCLHRRSADVWKLGDDRIVSRGFFCAVWRVVARQFHNFFNFNPGLGLQVTCRQLVKLANWRTYVLCTEVFLGKQSSVTFLSNVEQVYGRHVIFISAQ